MLGASSALIHTLLDGRDLSEDVCNVSMLMSHNLRTGAESEYITVKRFPCKHLCISVRICLWILKATAAVAAKLVALLADLAFNLQTLTYFFFPQYRFLQSKLKAADNRLALLSYSSWAPQMWSVTSWGPKLIRACSRRLHSKSSRLLLHQRLSGMAVKHNSQVVEIHREAKFTALKSALQACPELLPDRDKIFFFLEGSSFT